MKMEETRWKKVCIKIERTRVLIPVFDNIRKCFPFMLLDALRNENVLCNESFIVIKIANTEVICPERRSGKEEKKIIMIKLGRRSWKLL
jgi:hypothetical protein